MQYKTESRLRNRLVNELRLEGFEVQSVESGMTGRGIPDVFFAKLSGVQRQYECNFHGWIELKNITTELRDPVVIDFRKGQYEWLMRFAKEGVNVYLIVSCSEGLFVFKRYDIQKSYPLNYFLASKKLTKMKNLESVL